MRSLTRQLLAAILSINLVAFLYIRLSKVQSSRNEAAQSPLGGTFEPANATLGFAVVLAVSRTDSGRSRGLQYAANLTGIDIRIPSQPDWTDDDRQRIQSNNSKLGRGGANAWLGHLNALQWFLESGYATALVVEDDVDWDVRLRTMQIPRAAAAVRRMTNSTGRQPPLSTDYWGALDQWELLYLGHCGDEHHQTIDRYRAADKRAFADPTLLLKADLRANTRRLLDGLDVADRVRLLHRSYWPLCSFAYAVTRASAARLLAPHLADREPTHGCEAYDVRLLEACRDLGFLCYSVNPELLHHMKGPSDIAQLNHKAQDAKVEASSADADQSAMLDPHSRGFASTPTSNIGCSARSRDLYTSDPETLQILHDLVGRQGRCLQLGH